VPGSAVEAVTNTYSRERKMLCCRKRQRKKSLPICKAEHGVLILEKKKKQKYAFPCFIPDHLPEKGGGKKTAYSEAKISLEEEKELRWPRGSISRKRGRGLGVLSRKEGQPSGNDPSERSLNQQTERRKGGGHRDHHQGFVYICDADHQKKKKKKEKWPSPTLKEEKKDSGELEHMLLRFKEKNARRVQAQRKGPRTVPSSIVSTLKQKKGGPRGLPKKKWPPNKAPQKSHSTACTRIPGESKTFPPRLPCRRRKRKGHGGVGLVGLGRGKEQVLLAGPNGRGGERKNAAGEGTRLFLWKEGKGDELNFPKETGNTDPRS